MEINYTFNLWEGLLGIVSIGVSVFVAVWIYKLSKQLSAKDKFQHEKYITEEIKKLRKFESVLLADVEKYKPFRKDNSSRTYYKQGAELYTTIAGVGLQVILRPDSEIIPLGLIPFDWIEYVRDHDSEDNKTIIVCKFKGLKWFKNFKSPFKEINRVYENKNYNEESDPIFMRFTHMSQ